MPIFRINSRDQFHVISVVYNSFNVCFFECSFRAILEIDLRFSFKEHLHEALKNLFHELGWFILLFENFLSTKKRRKSHERKTKSENFWSQIFQQIIKLIWPFHFQSTFVSILSDWFWKLAKRYQNEIKHAYGAILL